MTTDTPVNPYAAPVAAVTDVDDAEVAQTFRLGLFSANGRIGRVRYLGYGVGFFVLMYVLQTVVSTIVSVMIMARGPMQDIVWVMTGMGVIGLLLFAVFFYTIVVLTIKRCHDIGCSGWLALLCLVPFAPTILLFIPGTKGRNRFGSQPPPQSRLATVATLTASLLVVGAFAAMVAVGVKAYHDYQVRVRNSQMQQTP